MIKYKLWSFDKCKHEALKYTSKKDFRVLNKKKAVTSLSNFVELAKQKEEVYTNPIIKEYKQLEKDLQNRLDQISKEIANCVSSKIKHPNEIGLINKH